MRFVTNNVNSVFTDFTASNISRLRPRTSNFRNVEAALAASPSVDVRRRGPSCVLVCVVSPPR